MVKSSILTKGTGDEFLKPWTCLLMRNNSSGRGIPLMNKRIFGLAVPASLFTIAAILFCASANQGKPWARFWGHERGKHGEIRSIMFSSDGKTLVVGDS